MRPRSYADSGLRRKFKTVSAKDKVNHYPITSKCVSYDSYRATHTGGAVNVNNDYETRPVVALFDVICKNT